MEVRKEDNILPLPRNASVHHQQLPMTCDSTLINNIYAPRSQCFDASTSHAFLLALAPGEWFVEGPPQNFSVEAPGHYPVDNYPLHLLKLIL